MSRNVLRHLGNFLRVKSGCRGTNACCNYPVCCGPKTGLTARQIRTFLRSAVTRAPKDHDALSFQLILDHRAIRRLSRNKMSADDSVLPQDNWANAHQGIWQLLRDGYTVQLEGTAAEASVLDRLRAVKADVVIGGERKRVRCMVRCESFSSLMPTLNRE